MVNVASGQAAKMMRSVRMEPNRLVRAGMHQGATQMYMIELVE